MMPTTGARRASGYMQPPDWKRTRARVLRHQPRCRINEPGCTGQSTTVDHIIPVSQGGTHHDTNLQGACHPCHDHKTERERSQAVTRRARQRPTRRPANLLD